MKIFMPIPGFAPHGGIRVIIEWANRLSRNNTVFLFNKRWEPVNWINIDKRVVKCQSDKYLKDSDCLIITSPHHIDLENHPLAPEKKFIFIQMLEHLFQPKNIHWVSQCKRFYLSKNPLISISKWNIEHIQKMGRKGEIFYIGNGINIKDFPIRKAKKDKKTILVEGWEATNPSKDYHRMAHKACTKLKKQGFKIMAYSQVPLKTYPELVDEYYHCPSNARLNQLYEQASILIKATKYDARSTSPIEAMTKGTPTVRGIIQGDDDLIHLVNSYRCDYNETQIYEGAMRLLNDNELYSKLSSNCITYVKENTWEAWMPKIEEILKA